VDTTAVPAKDSKSNADHPHADDDATDLPGVTVTVDVAESEDDNFDAPTEAPESPVTLVLPSQVEFQLTDSTRGSETPQTRPSTGGCPAPVHR
jgi:hypothetical protein